MPPDSSFAPGDLVEVIDGESCGLRGVIRGPGVCPLGRVGGEQTWLVWLPSPLYGRSIRESFLRHAEAAS